MLKLKNSAKKKKYLNDYRDLSKEAYKENRSDKINNWNKVGGSSNVGIYQNKDTGEIHQSIAGSHSISDFISDLFLGTLGIKDRNFRKREAEALEMAQRIDRIKLGNKHTVGGHSLGGNLTTRVIDKGLGSSGTTFNTFATQHDSHLTKHYKLTNVRNKNDFASTLIKDNKNNITTDNEGNHGMIESHSLNNIKF
jgi:hypothetical protein